MRQAVMLRPGELVVEDAPDPQPTGRDVLIHVEACGVCGSDRAIFAGTHPISTPVVLGHEFAGVVVDRGPEVGELQVGDRVAIDPNIPCGRCYYCRRGLIQLCPRLTPLGIVRPGGYATHALVPEANAYRLAAATSFDQAALVEPLACCIRGIQQAGVELGDVVLILGAGPIGLLLAQLARIRGAAQVLAVDPLVERRDLARQLGVGATLLTDGEAVAEAVRTATDGRGADVVIEASGQTSAAEAALDLVRPGGTVVWFGACPQNERVSVRPFHVNDQEITIRGSNINPFTHQTALTLIERGRIAVEPLVSEHIRLEDLSDGLRGPARTSGKQVVKPGGSP